jgi:DNA-binding CsgD family transcriptional regulator
MYQATGVSSSADMGLILVDQSSLDIVAADCGATLILKQHSGTREASTSLPPEMLQLIHKLGPTEGLFTKRRLRLGRTEYLLRLYTLSGTGDRTLKELLGIHLEKDWSTVDAVDEVSSRYHLTTREQEVLRGIALGLATKEMALQMEISPNTVKAFVRLVLIKMGVTTRAGAVAKLLSQWDGY